MSINDKVKLNGTFKKDEYVIYIKDNIKKYARIINIEKNEIPKERVLKKFEIQDIVDNKITTVNVDGSNFFIDKITLDKILFKKSNTILKEFESKKFEKELENRKISITKFIGNIQSKNFIYFVEIIYSSKNYIEPNFYFIIHEDFNVTDLLGNFFEEKNLIFGEYIIKRSLKQLLYLSDFLNYLEEESINFDINRVLELESFQLN